MSYVAPKGFSLAGICAGIKTRKNDFGLVLSDRDAVAAGCFTRSQASAASVVWSRERVPQKKARAVVIVSGNANCMAGPDEQSSNQRMAAAVAKELSVSTDAVLTCSTGAIGIPLPVEHLERGAPKLVSTLTPDPSEFAQSLLTTDTCVKLAQREIYVDGKRATVLGVAKGSGMIFPNMATMLGVIMTDACVASDVLSTSLRRAVEDSFNMINVDRDTSTNDAVLALANGASEHPPIESLDEPGGKALAQAIREVCIDLAKAIARDGEGARRLLEVRIRGARGHEEARAAAKSVVESNLAKAAMFGADPSFGRIGAAIGARYAELDYPLDLGRLAIALQGVTVYSDGSPQPFDEDSIRALLRSDSVLIEIDLGQGEAEATSWGCDLTYDYVRINADYATVVRDEPNGPVKADRRLDTKTPDLKSEILLSALEYIEAFAGTRAVVVASGSVLDQPELRLNFAADLRRLAAVGLTPIVVHAPPAAEERADDDDDILWAVRPGQGLLAALARAGAKAVGLSGKDGRLVTLGPQGAIEVHPEVLELVAQSYISVISPLGLSPALKLQPVDPFGLAAEVAVACQARKFIVLFDAPGFTSGDKLVSVLAASELRSRAARATGSQRALLDAANQVLSQGVRSVHFIDGRVPHNLVAELFTKQGVGTLVRGD